MQHHAARCCVRDRPFINAGDSPRLYGDVRAERAVHDPSRRVLEEIAELEAQAREATDSIEAKRLQCEAEELRCALTHNPRS